MRNPVVRAGLILLFFAATVSIVLPRLAGVNSTLPW
jgi:hypothetical protein